MLPKQLAGLLISVPLILLCNSFAAASKGTVLVLFEDVAVTNSYSQYLEHIKGLGYEIEKRSATDKGLHLREWDDWKYSKLIIFASGTQVFGGALDGEAILDFIDSGRDVILAVDSRASDEIRNLASDVGVDFEPRGSAVVDDHNHVTMAHGVDHTLVVSDAVLDSAAVLGPDAIFGPGGITDPIVFRGIGATFAADSEQVSQALGGTLTHYMATPGKNFTEDMQTVGAGITLVAIVQTRNDARVVVAGSMEMFTNNFLQATNIHTQGDLEYAKSGNEVFLVELTKWAFHERSVLRATNLRHHPPGTTEQPERYRITDEVEFEIDIHEYTDGSWQPYKASDVQLEFVMLDPHIRTFLQHDGQGRFFTRFKIPDVYGVFKFVIDYKRLGLTHLELSQQISVRHFMHNEFERFIVAAYPYYASAFSSMIAFLIFSFVFLYHREK